MDSSAINFPCLWPVPWSMQRRLRGQHPYCLPSFWRINRSGLGQQGLNTNLEHCGTVESGSAHKPRFIDSRSIFGLGTKTMTTFDATPGYVVFQA
ncbi:hypothetical protein [Curvibacter lanceolatus]|uniref:hypothetical protein n=1 Tax=Curvibacter lanceolatus TaxID=86182 RepID=UPI0012FC1E90|nr:hypothetical protein [Curvibacter lanceolatus]